MSLLWNHGVIGGRRLTPSLISGTGGAVTADTYTITPLVTPTSGRLIIITCGGIETRTIVTPPSGFTTISPVGGGRTCYLFWKIAGSEPANYTVVWSGVLSGGWSFTEWANTETISPFHFHVGANSSATSVTTISPAPSGYDAIYVGFAFTYMSKTNALAWAPDNGYTNFGGAGEHKIGGKTYATPALSQNLNWTGSSAVVNAQLIYIKGKFVTN